MHDFSQISELIQKYTGMSDNAKKGITEAGVVHQFLDPFLRALGVRRQNLWDIKGDKLREVSPLQR